MEVLLMPKQYKYTITFFGTCAEAVHGEITQKQAHFWKKNFPDYEDVNLYVQMYAEELDASGLIPEQYQLGMWHEIDGINHLNAPYFDNVSMSVEDEDGNEQSFNNLHELINDKNVLGEKGFIAKDYVEPTIDTKVDFYSYTLEKGDFYIENEEGCDNDDYNSDGTKDISLVLDEPFDIKHVKAVIEDFDGEKFLTQIQYGNNENSVMHLIGDGSMSKSSGTYFDEDTMTDDCEVLVLDEVTKNKVKLIIEGELGWDVTQETIIKKYNELFNTAS